MPKGLKQKRQEFIQSEIISKSKFYKYITDYYYFKVISNIKTWHQVEIYLKSVNRVAYVITT